MANAARTDTAATRAEPEAGRGEAAPKPRAPELAEAPVPAPLFETLSGIPVQPLYTPEDVKPGLEERLGKPGQFPFTRGLHPEMYRARVWTMRQFAGFGTAEHTNQRFHYLLAQGMTGLSTAFDMPTLMGYDPDHAMALGEVGREGVAISTLEDMEILFRGIPLDQVTTSMTINAPAIVLLAMYVVVAEEQGISPEKLGGTVQADMLKECMKRGMDVDDFAPRLSFFWDVHNDFFEEIAKFRAGRRIWARLMKDRFHAKNPRSWQLRTHAQTAGVSLTAQQPLNNVARVALQGLAAVLGGTQSLHTNSMDETLALPTEEAATVALRTQQILAYESGVVATPDPLGGSYFVEALTSKVEEEALRYIQRIDEMGGIIAAVERGYPQKEIADSAYKFQQQVEREERIIVGVNRFVSDEEVAIPVLKIDPEIERRQIERIQAVRARRDPAAHARAMEALRDACMSSKNLVPYVLDAVRAYATLGEISDVFREAYGVYREPAVF